MSSVSKTVLIGVVAAVAAIAGLLAAQLLLPAKTPQLESGTLLKQPRAIADFSLRDTTGAVFDHARLTGHWTLVFAGFTFCPDVCPSTLAVLKTLKTRLDAQKLPVEVVFVSVDPERDTLPKLDQYVHYFSPEFVGVTGAIDQLESLARSLSLVFAKVPGDTPETYTVDHSAALVLVDPQARVAAYFLPPHRVEVMAADLQRVVRRPQ